MDRGENSDTRLGISFSRSKGAWVQPGPFLSARSFVSQLPRRPESITAKISGIVQTVIAARHACSRTRIGCAHPVAAIHTKPAAVSARSPRSLPRICQTMADYIIRHLLGCANQANAPATGAGAKITSPRLLLHQFSRC